MALPSLSIRVTRATTLYIVGMLGIAHETLISEGDRPTLLLLFAAMIGLPSFLGKDEAKK